MCNRWSVIAALTMLLEAVTASAQLPTSAQGPSRSYTAGRYGIELTAPRAAHVFVESVAGGQPVSDVASGEIAAGGITKKPVAGVTFAPITIRGSAAELLTAFRDALAQPAVALDGRILAMDYDYKVHGEESFAGAPITQVVLSALDASSKAAPTVELTLAPMQVRMSVAAGGQFAADGSQLAKTASLDFQLHMPGLDDAMSHVMRVESIRMMQPGMASATGLSAAYAQRPPGRWQSGNVVLTIPVAHTEELSQWRQQLVAGGGSPLEKTLDLHLFAGARELLVLHASGVSLVSLRAVKGPSNESCVQAELVVQRWDVGQPSSTALK